MNSPTILNIDNPFFCFRQFPADFKVRTPLPSFTVLHCSIRIIASNKKVFFTTLPCNAVPSTPPSSELLVSFQQSFAFVPCAPSGRAERRFCICALPADGLFPFPDFSPAFECSCPPARSLYPALKQLRFPTVWP